MQKEGGAPSIASLGSASEGEGDGTPTPSEDRGEENVRGEAPPSIKCTISEQGTSLKANGSESTEIAKEEGMETDPPP
jgi:hypothetical protein